ncbi:DUF2326 domain-containing protein [Mariprofundus sp. NF]|uniref:DUF2326 domain-containing protein n=1 Tax=Mariprofundus sp. NF TaxID=2608716 RepID=UPI0015A39C64|nr:DUF2326 domain-containing protein [Mariprofundus sp. NF]NWF37985.1 DUF2326 domain-containing protein [Mariprofundus sp. NF]
MLKVRKLYSKPETFSPISFVDGFNLVMGETTEGDIKTNGVGKSMAIEFLNYGLLKRHSDSRVSLISGNDLSNKTVVCLDFEIGPHKITTMRSIETPECPTLIIDGESKTYSNLSDATEHLTVLLYESSDVENVPSVRQMMGPLIRDEGSEFKSIINCFDTDKRIPPDYTPHLFLLHIDPKPYTEAKNLYKQIQIVSKARKKMEDSIEAITEKKVSESKSDLNELESQVRLIQRDIDQLENIEGFDVVKEEIIAVENELEQERSRQGVLRSELSKIKLFRGDNYIDQEEVAELYNQFKEGLGDLIKKEIQEVSAFKQKIDNFQRTLIDNRRGSIDEDLKAIGGRIIALNRIYKEKLSLLDQEGFLKSLKQTIAIHHQKIEEHSALSSFINKYNDYDSEHKNKKRDRDEQVYLLESYVNDSIGNVESAEKAILDIHEYVYGNRKGSFDISVSKKAEIVNFDLRIDSDGSHSINREKVFLYDLALLLDANASDRHPGLLVHDNIFDVDQDTLIKSMNYISDNMSLLQDKQYILTINSDKFSESDHELLKFNVDDYSRAAYTKANKFLKMNYQELSRK